MWSELPSGDLTESVAYEREGEREKEQGGREHEN